MLNGIVNRDRLRWRDIRSHNPVSSAVERTLYNRWPRWGAGGEAGVFTRIMEGLAAVGAEPKTVMIDATYLTAHRLASSLQVIAGSRTPDWPHERRREHQGSPELVEGLQADPDANGRPLSFFMTAGRVSDYTSAASRLDDLPKAQWLIGDRGYDADWFRDALRAKDTRPCIPRRRFRNEPVRYDNRRYRRRSRTEIMFARFEDGRRVATRYDRRPTVFLAAVALAANLIFRL